MAASIHENPRSGGASSTTATISNVAGIKLIRTAGRPTRFRSFRSSVMPTRARMTIMAISRRSPDTARMSGLIRSSAWGPSKMPASSRPKSPGRCIFSNSPLRAKPVRIIKARLSSIIISSRRRQQKSRRTYESHSQKSSAIVAVRPKPGSTSFPLSLVIIRPLGRAVNGFHLLAGCKFAIIWLTAIPSYRRIRI